jgi:hypothetical protein
MASLAPFSLFSEGEGRDEISQRKCFQQEAIASLLALGILQRQPRQPLPVGLTSLKTEPRALELVYVRPARPGQQPSGPGKAGPPSSKGRKCLGLFEKGNSKRVPGSTGCSASGSVFVAVKWAH